MARDKRQVKHKIKQLQQVKTWQLLILLLLVGFIAATFLRLNNVGMAQRREAVLDADASGNRDALQNRLYDLQRYAAHHMNADTGPFYLEQTYKNDLQAQYEAASQDSNPSGNIYRKAQEICAPRFEVWSLAYVQCTRDELERFPSAENLTDRVDTLRADMYRHSFASPIWSPDFAGFTVLIFLLILGVIIARLAALAILKMMVKYRHRGG